MVNTLSALFSIPLIAPAAIVLAVIIFRQVRDLAFVKIILSSIQGMAKTFRLGSAKFCKPEETQPSSTSFPDWQQKTKRENQPPNLMTTLLFDQGRDSQ